MALTAALWSENLFKICPPDDHTTTLLSFPPEAKYCSSSDHFRPQIYCVCYCIFSVKSQLVLKSLSSMDLSLDPVARILVFQAMEPTLTSCPESFRVSFTF
jgi:hypothetical protein